MGGGEGEDEEQGGEHEDCADGGEVGGVGEGPGVAAGGVLHCEAVAGLGDDVGYGGCEEEEDAGVPEEEGEG